MLTIVFLLGIIFNGVATDTGLGVLLLLPVATTQIVDSLESVNASTDLRFMAVISFGLSIVGFLIFNFYDSVALGGSLSFI